MNTKFFPLVFFLFGSALIAQNQFENYEPLKCKGEIPEVFLKDLIQLSKESEKDIIKSNDRYYDVKSKKEFALKSSYFLNRMLLNGKVLFGDKLSKYVNEVGKNITAHSPEAKDIEFFVVKSAHVNAFTTNDGRIFISTGLIAQLETEAQLAYIIAHEIAHFTEEHVLKGFLYNETVDEHNAHNRDGEGVLMQKSAYSQDKELEADKVGMELFNESKYGNVSLQGVFDILKYAHLPIDEVKYDPSFLETEHFKFRANYFVDSMPDISPIENEKYSTHPGAEERHQAIHKFLAKRKAGKSFLLGKSRFIEMRNVARFELSSIFLRERRYQALLYHNFVLSKEFPDNSYLNKTTARGLYYLSKYSLAKNFDAWADLDYVQGESFKAFSFFDKVGTKDLVLSSANYMLELHKKYPKDPYYEKMAWEILRELHKEQGMVLKDYYTQTPQEFIKDLQAELDSVRNSIADTLKDKEAVDAELEDFEYERSSKYKKIERKEKVQIVESSVNVEKTDSIGGKAFIDDDILSLFIFCENLKDSSFVHSLRKAFEFPEGGKVIEKDDYVFYEKDLKVSSMITMDPISVVIDTRNSEPFKIKESAKRVEHLKESMGIAAKKTGIKAVDLSVNAIGSSEVDKFNDLYVINGFVSEIEKAKDLDSILIFNQEQLTAIADKYNVDHLSRNILVTFVKKDGTTFNHIIYSLLFYPITPFVIYDAATPDRLNYNLVKIYDLRTGKISLKRRSKIKGKCYDFVIKSNNYETLNKITD